ncbi:SelT/SelW/SelH family protein [Desulfopila sp. IMCC35006]|nr:SelT/SelW/SelH family protein [Desulfopila sp. IMCC35006]
MGDELKDAFGAEVTLLSSSGGVFEVKVDDTLIFSKKSLQRFPEEGEITLLLQAGRR